MTLSLHAAAVLAAQCAPAVAPETLLSIVQVESRFNPLAIGVNGAPPLTVAARSPSDAAQKAHDLIAQGRSVDLGLAQINSANLAWLGLSVEAAFDPCRNLAAAQKVLQAGFRGGDGRVPDPAQEALNAALSRYNTGSAHRGLANGYVAKVKRAAEVIVPALRAGGRATSAQDEGPERPPAPPPEPAAPNAWDVFGDLSAGQDAASIGQVPNRSGETP